MTQELQTDVVNDPLRDFELCIEISLPGRIIGSVFRVESGEIVLRIFPGSQAIDFPSQWLSELLQSAENDLPRVT